MIDIPNFGAFVVVLTIHEFSHAFVSYRLGDPTAKNAGRLTLNPLAHLDLVGTFLVIFFQFGWAKPVPIQPHYFKNPKRDNLLTSFAGPFSNLILALVLNGVVKYFGLWMPSFLTYFFELVEDVALYLFIFNMLPIPPLDGAAILEMLIPRRFQHIYDRYLQNAMVYFVIFIAFDHFVLAEIFHQSIFSNFLGTIFVFLKSLLFLGN